MVNVYIAFAAFLVYNVFAVGSGDEEQLSGLWRRTVREARIAKRIKQNLDGRRTDRRGLQSTEGEQSLGAFLCPGGRWEEIR